MAFSVNQSELDHLQTLYKSSVRSKRSFFKHRSRLFSGRRSNKIGTSAAADTDNSVTSQGSAASSNGPGKILPAITLDPSRLHQSNNSENIEDISKLKTKLSDNVFQVPPPGKSIDVSSRKKMAPKFDGGEFIELQEKLQKLTNASKTSHETFASEGCVDHQPIVSTRSGHFFLFPFWENSLICLEGKSMTPHRGNTTLFRSSQQLPRLCLGPSKGFLS